MFVEQMTGWETACCPRTNPILLQRLLSVSRFEPASPRVEGAGTDGGLRGPTAGGGLPFWKGQKTFLLFPGPAVRCTGFQSWDTGTISRLVFPEQRRYGAFFPLQRLWLVLPEDLTAQN